LISILLIHASHPYNRFIIDTLESLGALVQVACLDLDTPKIIQEQNPELIILDANEINGTAETCKMLRLLSPAPLVVLSNTTQSKIIASILDSGADDYLVKPVSKELLQARINTLVRRKTIPSYHSV
jgi:DNA-binding response OmpR family regulator